MIPPTGWTLLRCKWLGHRWSQWWSTNHGWARECQRCGVSEVKP